MDSARDFDLLGESVPQVRVSARTLALSWIFSSLFILTPFSFQFEYILFELFGGRSSQPFDWLPFREGENVRTHLGGRCVKSTWNIFG